MFAVPGRLPDGTRVVTTIRHDRRARMATIRLADIPPFTVVVRGQHLADLSEALREGDSLGVPCRHAVHGDWLLGVHPHQWWVNPHAARLPMELYLLLPDDQQLVVVFTPEEVDQLLFALPDLELLGADQ
ncbi:hypothetical protein [Kutzneria buriramensis]|uniref:Uncharacterized protein n=1 Tax=Kutzneria buriramensis TaxID=1045776 RepID=A0A3E0HHP2_9PSEU|nr:hypothetical protein [Kutzneria buriramensis]REH44876.1 hypothetical protein BCF44_108357 [Kutzneria buriramensis]